MAYRKVTSAILLSFVILAPVVYDLAMAGQLNDVMITASIPDHTPVIRLVLLIMLVLIGAFCKELIVEQAWLGALTLVSSLWLLANSGEYYTRLCERHLFSGPTRLYSRIVKIEKVRREYARSGARFYAQLYLGTPQADRPEVKVGEEVFSMWKAVTSSEGMEVGDLTSKHPECLLRVSIAKVGAAERIIVRGGQINSTSVLACRSNGQGAAGA